MLVDGERNLDLLYGIMVFTGWSQAHVHPTPIITNLVQLAMSIIADLGLNRPPPKCPQHLILNYDARGCPKPLAQPTRTIEERRAVLGVFWLSSVLFTYFKRIEPLRWSELSP